MKIVPVPTDEYGTFYNGDAYIIYACTEYGKHGGMIRRFFVHFLWPFNNPYRIKDQ